MGMCHWEADQEDFLVLSGEALLLVEGEERPLRQWDFVHCPAETKHVVVGAGDGPCAVLAIGACEHQTEAGWGGYTVDEVALRQCRRRAGDDRGEGGLRAVPESRADALPRRLAFLVG
jgi:uncharacterized cupin superfamily protein